MYSPTMPLSDPLVESPIVDGVAWVQGAALGSTATTVAVIAVAAIGLLMLSGRLEWRRGITAVAACFILFGATKISSSLTGLETDQKSAHARIAAAPSPLYGQWALANEPPAAYDPYAGASVPASR